MRQIKGLQDFESQNLMNLTNPNSDNQDRPSLRAVCRLCLQTLDEREVSDFPGGYHVKAD
jgi:hypothetical protein